MVGVKREVDLGSNNCVTVLGNLLGIIESLGRDCDGLG